jgi:hypothetical protein
LFVHVIRYSSATAATRGRGNVMAAYCLYVVTYAPPNEECPLREGDTIQLICEEGCVELYMDSGPCTGVWLTPLDPDCRT